MSWLRADNVKPSEMRVSAGRIPQYLRKGPPEALSTRARGGADPVDKFRSRLSSGRLSTHVSEWLARDRIYLMNDTIRLRRSLRLKELLRNKIIVTVGIIGVKKNPGDYVQKLKTVPWLDHGETAEAISRACKIRPESKGWLSICTHHDDVCKCNIFKLFD